MNGDEEEESCSEGREGVWRGGAGGATGCCSLSMLAVLRSGAASKPPSSGFAAVAVGTAGVERSRAPCRRCCFLAPALQPRLRRAAGKSGAAAAAAGAPLTGSACASLTVVDARGTAHVNAALPLMPLPAPAKSPARYTEKPASPPRATLKPTLYAPASEAAARTNFSWRRALRLPSTAALRAAAGTRDASM